MNKEQRSLKLKLLSLKLLIEYALKMFDENNLLEVEEILKKMKNRLSGRKTKTLLRNNDGFGKMEEGVE